MVVRKDIKEFLNTIPNNVTIVAATKYVDSSSMRDLYHAGITNLAENRVDSFLRKHDELSDLNITWHFIGHLQRNKARKVVGMIDCLHSLDSLDLASIIDKSRKTPLDCFIEVSINEKKNKNGISINMLKSFIEDCLQYHNIHIIGLMMMAIANSDKSSLHHQFSQLRELRDSLQNSLGISLPYLSMGMSDDYLIAIKEGATHIRLGRILFK